MAANRIRVTEPACSPPCRTNSSRSVARRDLGADLPQPGRFAAGLVFLPQVPAEREKCKQTVEEIVAGQGQRVVGWRPVPTDAEGADVGPTARAGEPRIEQLFVAAGEGLSGDAFERQLYMIRKRSSHVLRNDASMTQAKMFYICSLSTKVQILQGHVDRAPVDVVLPGPE